MTEPKYTNKIFKWNSVIIKNQLHPKLKKRNYLKIIPGGIVLSSFITLAVYGIFVSFKSGDKIDAISQGCIALIIYQLFLTALLFLKHATHLALIYDSVDDFFSTIHEQDEKIRKICDSFVMFAKIIDIAGVIAGIMAAAIFPATYLYRTLDNVFSDSPYKKLLIFDLHLPLFDDLKYEWPLNEIVNVYLIILAVCGTTIYVGWNGMMGTFFMYIIYRLKIVCYKIENLFVDCFDDPVLIKRRLAKIVEYHEDVYKIFSDFRVCVTFFIGNIMLFFSIFICLAIYMLWSVLQSDEGVGEFMCFVLTGILQMTVISVAGTMIADGSTKVATSVYMSGWENCDDIGIKRSLFIMLMRSQEPIILNIFGIYKMDMTTLAMILNASWSYFTVIRSTS